MTKIILVTGSSDGIGKHLATILASEGHEVILHGRNPKKLQATLQEIKEKTENARLHAYLADLRKLSDTLDMMKAITKKENWVSQKGHSVVMTA